MILPYHLTMGRNIDLWWDWYVNLYKERTEEVWITWDMIKYTDAFGYFALEAVRDGEIIPWIQKWDRLIFAKVDKFIDDGFYLFKDIEYETHNRRYDGDEMIKIRRISSSPQKTIVSWWDVYSDQYIMAILTWMIREL